MPPSSRNKWSRRPPAPPGRGEKGRRLLLLLLSLGAVTVGGLALLESPPPPPVQQLKPAPPPATLSRFDSEQGLRFVTLFFADADGRGLVSEIQQRPPCPDQAACIDDTLQALLQGPSKGGSTLLPRSARLKLTETRGETAWIDLDRNTVNRIHGGVMSEILCLTALANTVAVNFPHLRQIAILIDGAPAATLKGHVDLTTPFRTNFDLVRPTANPPATQQPITSTESHAR